MNDEAFFESSDDEAAAPGHPLQTKSEVLEGLRNGYKYHKNGPAREYSWNKQEIAVMTKLIMEKNELVKAAKKNRSRRIRAQLYDGTSTGHTLINWVNSCLTGKRFPENKAVQRGPAIAHGDWSNHKMWCYVSSTLQAEFHYWNTVNSINKQLGSDEAARARYPKLTDLIFRHNDDFVSGLWSEFSEYWQPFIDELR